MPGSRRPLWVVVGAATITGTIRLPADGLHLHYGRTGLLSEVDRARAAGGRKERAPLAEGRPRWWD
jgi:hypothetical protein